MKIVMRSVEDLIPYVNNPRNNDDAVDAVASSIKNFGFQVPIVIDKGNELVTGHTRLKAAKKLGMTEVPCIVADNLSPEQVKAFRLADNKVGEIATWNFESLMTELEGLQDLREEMTEIGFSYVNLQELEVSDDDFSTNETHEKKTKTIVCPHCGEEVELK